MNFIWFVYEFSSKICILRELLLNIVKCITYVVVKAELVCSTVVLVAGNLCAVLLY